MQSRTVVRASVLIVLGALPTSLGVALLYFGTRGGNGAVLGGFAVLAGLAILGGVAFFIGGPAIDALWLKWQDRKDRER